MVFDIARQAVSKTEEILRLLLVLVAIAFVWLLDKLERCKNKIAEVPTQHWKKRFNRKQKVCLEDGMEKYYNKHVEHANFEISDKESVISSVDESTTEMNVDLYGSQSEVLQNVVPINWTNEEYKSQQKSCGDLIHQIETSVDQIFQSDQTTFKQVQQSESEGEFLPQKSVFEMQNTLEVNVQNKVEPNQKQDEVSPQQKLSKSKRRRNRSKKAKLNRANSNNMNSNMNNNSISEPNLSIVEPPLISSKSSLSNKIVENKPYVTNVENVPCVINVPSAVSAHVPPAGEALQSPQNPSKKSRRSRKNRNQNKGSMHASQNGNIQVQQNNFCEQSFQNGGKLEQKLEWNESIARYGYDLQMQEKQEMDELLDHIEVVRFKSAVDPSAIEWYESNLSLISSIDVRLLVRKLHGNLE